MKTNPSFLFPAPSRRKGGIRLAGAILVGGKIEDAVVYFHFVREVIFLVTCRICVYDHGRSRNCAW